MCPRANSYVENFCNHLRRNGYSEKYEKAGIYSISIDQTLVYIGKSHNMLVRVAQHYVNIKKQEECKYRIMAEACRKHHSINFDVMYYAKEIDEDAITEEIGQKEGELIRQYRPALNTQIPHEDNWREYDFVPIDVRKVRETLL